MFHRLQCLCQARLKLIQWLRNALPDATTHRKRLLTKLEEVTTNQGEDDKGALTGEAKQEEVLARRPCPSGDEDREVVVKNELKHVDMHMATEQMFVLPLPPDSVKRASAESASSSSKRMKSLTLSQSWCAHVRLWTSLHCALGVLSE